MRIIQHKLYEQLRTEGQETRERITSIIKPLDAAKLNEHPEPNGWSVGQVLEHLCVVDELYEDSLKHILATAPKDPTAQLREWKSSFIGGMIAESMLKPKPLKRPGKFEPGSTPREGVVDVHLSRERDFLAAMDESTSFDWRALRVKSPALPSWAPSMNLGDGFRIHIVHLTRHSHQIERVASKL